jgi:hypothetical protein
MQAGGVFGDDQTDENLSVPLKDEDLQFGARRQANHGRRWLQPGKLARFLQGWLAACGAETYEAAGRASGVSNKLPVKSNPLGHPRLSRSSGGLASALDAVWRGQHGIWIGWAGAGAEAPSADALLQSARGRSYSFKPVLFQRRSFKFYSGFANEIIWPLFHDASRCD